MRAEDALRSSSRERRRAVFALSARTSGEWQQRSVPLRSSQGHHSLVPEELQDPVQRGQQQLRSQQKPQQRPAPRWRWGSQCS